MKLTRIVLLLAAACMLSGCEASNTANVPEGYGSTTSNPDKGPVGVGTGEGEDSSVVAPPPPPPN